MIKKLLLFIIPVILILLIVGFWYFQKTPLIIGALSSEISIEYSIDGSQLIRTDEFTAKIGEVSSVSPSLELSKESSHFKLTPRDIEVTSVEYDKNKVKYLSTDKEYHIYSTDKGYENDLIINNPGGSSFTFDVESNNVDFIKKEIPCFVSSTSTSYCIPEIYYLAILNTDTQIVGENNYSGTGYFKISEPIITDRIGKTSTGSLNIENGIMTIKVDENFLRIASYPITIDPKMDYYNPTVDDGWIVSAANTMIFGQTFTTTETYDVYSVKFKLFKVGTPGTVTFAIRATSGEFPTGSNLASGTFAGADLTTDTAGEDREVLMSAYELQSGVKYALVAYCDSISYPTHYIQFRSKAAESAYAGGNLMRSTNTGSTWSGLADFGNLDFWFEVWGEAPTGPTGEEFYNVE